MKKSAARKSQSRKVLLPILAGSIAVMRVRESSADAAMAVAWGQNDYDQLGNGNMTDSSSPVAVRRMSTNIYAVTGGFKHTLAVQNGGVYAWGSNLYGELGNGSNAQYIVAAPVIGLTHSVSAIAAGEYDSLAVQNGAVYSWGWNNFGQLGNGTTTTSYAPIAVNALSGSVTAIASGGLFNLAIQNGGVYSWGYNFDGELGNGSVTTTGYHGVDTPVAINKLSTGVTVIAGGASHALAIQNGSIYAWGNNGQGELGNGSTINSATPVAVQDLSSGVTAIAGGNLFSLAVKNGGVYSWGYNNVGQLGDGTTNNEVVPEQIDPKVLTNIVAVSANVYSSYALSSDGSLWDWGSNAYGDLGLGSVTTDYLTPQHLLPPTGYVFTSIEANSDGFDAVATFAAVPEPACLSLLATTGLAFLRRRL